MRHYGPDDYNHSCWYNYAHKGGPEQPNFLKTGGVVSKQFFYLFISKCEEKYLYISYWCAYVPQWEITFAAGLVIFNKGLVPEKGQRWK